MPCGCQAQEINIVGGSGINVQNLGGGKFEISLATPSVPVIVGVDDPGELGYTYVWHETDVDGDFVATHTVVV